MNETIVEENDWDYLEMEDLPLSSKAVAEILGFEDTKALMKVFPSNGVYIPREEAIESTIVGKTIGREKAQKLSKFYRGSTLILYTSRALSKARSRRIRQEASKNLPSIGSRFKYYSELAKNNKLSVQRIREIINY